MIRLKTIKMYDLKDVPDHVIEEVVKLSGDLEQAVRPHIINVDPNLLLGAFAFLHASIVKHVVSEDPEELENAAQNAAIAIYENIKFLAEKSRDV